MKSLKQLREDLAVKEAKLAADRERFGQPKPTALIEARRPTVTRTVLGGILFGPLGALAGFAAQKKEKRKIW